MEKDRTVSTRILKRSVIRHLPGHGENRISTGEDFMVTETGQAVALGEGETAAAALLRAEANLAMAGVRPREAVISLLAGRDCPEEKIRRESEEMAGAAVRGSFAVLGGNTVRMCEGTGLHITVTLTGKADRSVIRRRREKILPGSLVLVAGTTGAMGAADLISDPETGPQLSKVFSPSFLERAAEAAAGISGGEIYRQARRFLDAGALFVTDVSFGGIYRTFYDLADARECGIIVRHEAVPIRQDTIEIAEVLDLNPYLLDGTGCVVAVFHPEEGRRAAEELHCSVSAVLTTEKEKKVVTESGGTRFLTLYE